MCISKLKIEGFWGDKNIDIDFNEDINFIIGVNGSGKTTLVNLLAACLQGNILKLIDFEFKKIEIYLEKEAIIYGYKETDISASLDGKLPEDIKVSWLPIHKANLDDFSDKKPRETPVDTKLKNVEDDLSKLFSGLDKKVNETIERHFKALASQADHSDISEDWEAYNREKQQILLPKENFTKKLNELFQRKTVEINDRNEIKITTQSGKDLSTTELSSGEKQLIIILGEALLQENKPWIYISDEPELSLHVKWQESLVRNIRDLNPNAQIIFATHSPDIVSTYRDKVFDMEKLLDA